jgi:hypothetical protein
LSRPLQDTRMKTILWSLRTSASMTNLVLLS